MADWEVALIGVAGTALGALIAIVDHRVSAHHEDRQRREERLATAKQAMYQQVMLWVSNTDELLHNVFYSYGEYMTGTPVQGQQWPVILATKRSEYRTVTPPEKWAVPAALDEITDVQLQALGSPDVTRTLHQAEFAATRVVDEAGSLGVSTILNSDRTPEQVSFADNTIGGWYKSWLLLANRILNLIRADLDPSLVPVPVDKERLFNWDEVVEPLK